MKTKLFILLTLTLMLFTITTNIFAQRSRSGFRHSNGIYRTRVIGFSPSYYAGFFYGSPFGFYASPFGYDGFYYQTDRDYASIDFNVEPQDAIIYIDDAYLGKVDDYNGYPGTAHVLPGKHVITVKTKDGQEYTKELYAQPNKETDFNYRFEGY